MTISETRNVLGVLQLAYPDGFRGLSDDALVALVKLWQQSFAAESKELVLAAVQAHICSTVDRFMPTIGVIKDEVRKLTTPEQMTEAEAWALISKALTNGIYGSSEEFDKLPPVLQRVVGSPAQLREWAQLDVGEVQTVVASNVQRSFRTISARETELAKLPPSVWEQMKQLSGTVFKPLGDGGTEACSCLPSGGAGG